eukprot:scaffold14091_cov28-Tisochrysis_lutea.AAC.2
MPTRANTNIATIAAAPTAACGFCRQLEDRVDSRRATGGLDNVTGLRVKGRIAGMAFVTGHVDKDVLSRHIVGATTP